MNNQTFIPSPALRPFVKAYRIIESREGMTNRVIPSTSLTMAFRLHGKIAYRNDDATAILPTATFSGLRKTVRLIQYAPASATLVVLFHEAGIAPFFPQPLHELFEQSIELDHCIPPAEVQEIEEKLAEASNHATRIALIDSFLLSKLLNSHPDQLITTAIATIHAAQGNMRIKALTKQLYISQDAFEKRFRKATGATPKQFAHIVRMNAAIRQYDPHTSFLDIALDNGYYDQPHFNKDFKLFTGQTPATFFSEASFW